MRKVETDDLRSEYSLEELGSGTRGKYLKEYQKGTNLVLISPDVAKVFPDEESVNQALRSLINVARKSAGETGLLKRINKKPSDLPTLVKEKRPKYQDKKP